MNGIKIVWRTAAAVVALLSLSLLTAGCIEELRQGGKVSFTASTGYLNGGVKGETKTFYSGDIQSAEGSRYERINWVTGDLVKIYCEQSLGQESDPTKKSAVYTVTAASSPSGATDKAEEIKPKSPDTDLRWDVSGGKHHFFAAYPSDVTFNTSYYAGKSDVIVFEHSVPAVQVVTQEVTRGTTAEFAPDMTLVAMGAYSAKEAGGLNPTVDLYFRPLVTTLRVELLAGDELSKNNKLTMLQLKSSSDHSTYPLAGSYTVAVGDYNNHKTDVFADGTDVYGSTGFKPFGFSPAPAATENVVRIVPDGTVFPQAGIQLDATAPTAFTFVMLPVADMELTLQLTFGGTYDATTQTVTGGTTRSLELKATQSGITDWWSPPALRKSYLRQVGVKKKTFKVARLSVSSGQPQDWTESTGTAVSYADALVAPKEFNSILSYFKFRVFSENLGGFEAEVTTTSGDTYIGSNSSLVLTPVSETGFNSETDRGLSLHFRTSALGSAGTTLGIPSGTFTPKAFTVSASGKKVYFSPGNLRYLASTTTWAFAPSQHDFIGIASGNTTIDGRETQSDWIDFFHWATSGWDGGTAYTRTAYQPYEINNGINAYWPSSTPAAGWSLVGANAHGDWGVHNSPIDGESWRLLTLAEMEYLFNRPNSFLLAALPSPYPEFTISFKAKDDPNYKVSYIVKKPMICGVILFPDGFDTNLIDASIRGNIGKRNLSDAIYHAVVKNWPELENAGCVFLPEGRAMRGNNGISGDSGDGFYFTSTASSGHYVGALTFGGAYQGARVSPESWLSVSNTISEITYGGIRVPIAGCVRLVKDTDWTGTTTPYNPDGTGGFGDGYSRLRLTAEAMWVGDATQVVAVMATDDGGRIVSNPAISNWRSSDTDVATVDGSGRVQALAAGTTTISATWTHNGTPINGRMTLHVRQLGAITLTATPAEIEVGGTSVLTVSIAYTDSNKQPTATSAPPVGWVVTPEAGRTDGWKVNNTHVSFDASTRTATGASDGTTAISYSITRSGRANSGSPKSGETTITVISKIGTIDPYAAGGSSGFIIR